MSERPFWQQVRAEICCPATRLAALGQKVTAAELDSLLKSLGLSVVASLLHRFGNDGLTYIAILEVSHLAIHSWPEHEVVLVDLFSCVEMDGAATDKCIAGIATWLGGTVVASDRRRR